MIKECQYCSNEFNASRSDAKYCSKSCKQQAYTMRQANPHIQQSSDTSTYNDVNMSHRRKNAKPTIPLSENHLGSLINGAKSNQNVLNHLLTAMKENGHIMSDSSKIEIELMFTKEKLESAYRKIEELKEENDRIYDKLERFDGGYGNRLMQLCESNSQLLMILAPLVSKINPDFDISSIAGMFMMGGSEKSTKKTE